MNNMIEMVNEKGITRKEAKVKYPNCKMIMIHTVDDCKGTITGDLVVVSTAPDDFDELCEYFHKYARDDADAYLFGDYAEGGAIGVQYEIKR